MVYQIGRYTTIPLFEMLYSKLDSPELLRNICYDDTTRYLPELLGKVYLDFYFDKKVSQSAQNISNMLQRSFHQLLSESKWMDSHTTAEAIAKLDSMKINVANPE